MIAIVIEPSDGCTLSYLNKYRYECDYDSRFLVDERLEVATLKEIIEARLSPTTIIDLHCG
jgi:hypothetical protein